jgi:NAD-dependent deacetylase
MARFQDRFIQRIVVLTGAGISAESGVPTFRDADGLWEKHDPMDIATPEAFARDPTLVYRFYNERRNKLCAVKPNAAHTALAELAKHFDGEVFLVSQNVDDLHERGGSEQVCHMHGQLQAVLCTACKRSLAATMDYDGSSVCPACSCGGTLRPDVVWFGEIPYFMEEIEARLSECDLFIAIGTSGLVYPAAGFVRQARLSGATTVEINREISDVTDLFHHQRQGLATVEVARLVGELLEQA